MFDYQLTKSKIKAGLQCRKKLWYDGNDPLRVFNHSIKIGDRFGSHIKSYYGDGVDLSGELREGILDLTHSAINDPVACVIYEPAFFYSNTLIRADVLIRKGDKWQLVEAKSSSTLHENHLIDAAIQAYIIQKQGIALSSITIAHINGEFIYRGSNNYENFIVEINVDEEVSRLLPLVPEWIENMLPVIQRGSKMPTVEIGEQCKDRKNTCIYFDRCESQTHLGQVEVPIKIIPNLGNRLQKEWLPRGVFDLRELPAEALANVRHRRIQRCHQRNEEWIDPNLVREINGFEWPRYFIDFETVQQGVPLISDTRPYEAFPFQFSVHKWEYQDQVLSLAEGQSFLEFSEEGMDRRFLISLIDALGTSGPIFTHNSSTEISAMEKLAVRKDCSDLRPLIDKIVSRVIDTVSMMRNGFYNPIMMGSYSLKKIVKVLPGAIDYSNASEDVGDGGAAMIKWFEYTDPECNPEKKLQIRDGLKKYCAQDTLNLYHLFRYIGSAGQSLENRIKGTPSASH